MDIATATVLGAIVTAVAAVLVAKEKYGPFAVQLREKQIEGCKDVLWHALIPSERKAKTAEEHVEETKNEIYELEKARVRHAAVLPEPVLTAIGELIAARLNMHLMFSVDLAYRKDGRNAEHDFSKIVELDKKVKEKNIKLVEVIRSELKIDRGTTRANDLIDGKTVWERLAEISKDPVELKSKPAPPAA